MSFRLKTVLGIALIEAILLAFLIFSVLGYLKDSNEEQLLNRVNTTVTLFATAVKDAVIATDLATLESIVDSVMDNPGIVFARVLDVTDLVLAEKSLVFSSVDNFVENTSSEDVIDNIFRTSRNIVIDGEKFGTVQLGFDIRHLKQMLEEAQEKSISIAMVEMILVGLFSTFLGVYLTRQLKRLRDASNAIASGQHGYQIEASGNDEITATIRAFNKMSSEVERDVNLLKEAKYEISVAKDEAEKANKAKSEFLSNMSHELRTPLNAIIGFAQLLEIDGVNDDQKDSVNEIKKAGEHLLSLINQVLDLSKIEAGRFELSMDTVDLDSLVDECLSLISPLQSKHNIEVTKHVNTPNLLLNGDYLRIKQVLINLLSNAIKYNKPSGEVIIQTSKLDSRYCRILIQDTGIGISQNEIRQLFKPFQRLNADNYETEGTGIGLFISKSLVELMNGSISVESEVGQGSKFIIDIPLSDIKLTSNDDNQDAESRQPVMSDMATRKSILYIEDNPSNQRLVKKILAPWDKRIDLFVADNGIDGFELFQRYQPDLVLLDINLPDMSGIDIINLIKDKYDIEKTPVIAVTANAMATDLERYEQEGFAHCITKPIDIQDFCAVIDRYLLASDKLTAERND